MWLRERERGRGREGDWVNERVQWQIHAHLQWAWSSIYFIDYLYAAFGIICSSFGQPLAISIKSRLHSLSPSLSPFPFLWVYNVSVVSAVVFLIMGRQFYIACSEHNGPFIGYFCVSLRPDIALNIMIGVHCMHLMGFVISKWLKSFDCAFVSHYCNCITIIMLNKSLDMMAVGRSKGKMKVNKWSEKCLLSKR